MCPAALLALFVLVLAEVHDPAHRGLRGRRHLDQVEGRLLRALQCVADIHHAQLLAVGADHTDLSCADPVVHTWFRGDTRCLLSGMKTPGTAAYAIPGRVYGLSATGAGSHPRPVRSGWLLLRPFTTAWSITWGPGTVNAPRLR